MEAPNITSAIPPDTPTNYNQYAIIESANSLKTDNEVERLQDIVFLTLYSVTCVLSLLGNSLVCYVVFGKSSMRNFTNLLLVNMAISDILCALAFPAGLLICWDSFLMSAGKVPCVTAKVIQLWSFQVSSVTMTFIALDRFMLVTFPLVRTHRVLPVSVVIMFVWLVSFSIIVGTSPSLAFHRFFNPTATGYIQCEIVVVFASEVLTATEQRIRLIIANLAHFWIPLLVVVVTYGSISWKVFRRRVGSLTALQQDALLRAKWKTIKMLIAAVAVFLLCWFPFFILNLLDFIGNPQRKRPCNKSGPFFIAVWIAFTSCCWNPIVYWIYSEDYRNGLKIFGSIFGKCFTRWRCSQQKMTISDQSSQRPGLKASRFYTSNEDCRCSSVIAT